VEFPTLEEAEVEGKRVLIRLDINSPLDPRTGEILDDLRIRGHLPTLRALHTTRLVVLAHQSRPGLEDFTTLEKHAERIEALLGRPVKYIDDLFGSAARGAIQRLKDGEILVLENVRFSSEEVCEEVTSKPPEEQARTHFVRKLSASVDTYVNDAFAVSHRSQPSVVAFPVVLPSCGGKLMETEVKNLSRVLKGKNGSRVFAFGGAKVKDSLRVMRALLKNGTADVILTSGLIANLLLLAQGKKIGETNRKTLEAKYGRYIEEAKRLLQEHGEKIRVPMDLAFQKNGEREEAPVDDFPDSKILDIGIETIAHYSGVIGEAGVVVANGPCGVFEIADFALGTEELLRSMAQSKAFSVIGGGHLSAIADGIRVAKSLSYISTGGKATLSFLAGETLPGIEALKRGRVKGR
jgi:phosphoglycerate kinase